MRLTDYPRRFSLQDYTFATESMVEKLKRCPGVVSIYQIGGVGNPGISDIDLFVIFGDDAQFHLNPLDGLSRGQQYLFIHNLFGATSETFVKSQKYNFFHDYKLVYGSEFPIGQQKLSEEEREAVNIQAALEYLVKMYINMTVERTYGIIRVRGLLLLAKALMYDLDALKINFGSAFDMVRQVLDWRNHWFESNVDSASLINWHDRFYGELTGIIKSGISGHGLFIPSWVNLSIASNMTLAQSGTLGFRHRGISLPSVFAWMGRKYFNLQHRLNKFVFEVPFKKDDVPAPVLDRHSFIADICEHNSWNLPYFIPAPYGLPLFRRKRTTPWQDR